MSWVLEGGGLLYWLPAEASECFEVLLKIIHFAYYYETRKYRISRGSRACAAENYSRYWHSISIKYTGIL